MIKKIHVFVLSFLSFLCFFLVNNKVEAVTEYYTPSYCPALSVTGIPGVNTHIIRVGGSTGKIAYCLDPFGDVPYLGHEIYESDGSIGTMNSSHRLNYNGELDLPGVSFIIHYGDSPLYINDYSGGNRIISSNYQWMPYVYDYGTGSYSVATGNNVSYEDTRGYAVTQYAIWWYQDLMEPGTWDTGSGSGAAYYKDFGMNSNPTSPFDPHVKYPDDQTRAEAIAMARESADLACSAYAATHGIYTVSSLPSECRQVYNNGQSISPILHQVISERISWGNSSVDITTGSLSFTHEGNYFVSNAINFTSHNLITDNGVRVLNYSSLPDGTRVILADGTTINKNDLANRALTTGFKLSIPDSVENTKVTLSLYGDGSNDKITFYYPSVESTSSHAFQRLFVTDDIYVSDSVSGTTPEVPKTAGLFVYKEDANDSSIKLSGAVFELYRKDGSSLTYIAEATTNSNGEVQFLNLEYGTYVIKEVTAPNGYKITTASQEVTIDANAVEVGALTKVFEDAPKIGSITITKLNSVNNNKLEGIKFKLYYDADCTREVTTDFYGEAIGELVTDKNGVITIDRLGYGTYYLKEVATLDNYLLLKDPISLTINESTENVTRTVYNEPLGSIIVTKKDSTHSDINLAGAEFQLLDASNNPVTTDANGTPLGTLKTGSDGRLVINNLRYGTYKLKEVGAPPNYSIVTEVTNASLNGNSTSVTINNKANVGNLTIYKYDDYSDKPLADVTFKLYRNSACTDEVTTDFYGNPIGTLTTNDEGLITISDLLYGTYYLKETSFKEGYKKDETVRTVVINSSATNVRVEVANTPVGTIIINKTDSSNNSIKLSGAVFELYDSSGKRVTQNANGENLGTLTTNSSGLLMIENLKYGTYTLKETKAPDNYTIVRTETAVNLNKGAVEVNITNKSNIAGLTIHKYNSLNNNALADVTFKLYRDRDCTDEVTTDFYGNPLGTLKTNASGNITVSNLLYGTYYLKETTFLDGYKKDTTVRTVTINADNTSVTINVPNVPLGSITINKIDASANNLRLAGAVFELYDEDDNRVTTDAYGTNLGILKTNENGVLTISNLEYGTYKLKEITAPANYSIVKEITEVTLNSGSTAVTITNKSNVGRLTIHKYNSLNNNALADVEFKLYRDRDCTNEVTTDFYGNSLGTLKTDAAGNITVSNLLYGTYYLKETTFLEHYKKDETVRAVTINASNTSVTINVANVPLGSITITKVDADHNNLKLQGAVFELYDNNDRRITTDAYGTSLGTLKTDSNGVLTINNLEYGTYKLKEITAPNNYTITKTTTSVTLNGNSASVTIDNQANVGVLTIYKYDRYSNKPLKGVEFKLYRNSACTEEVTTDFYGNPLGTLTTNDEGLITVSNLLYGTYYLKETKFLDNYKIDESIKTVVISRTATNVRVEVANDPIATLTIYKYNDQTEQALAGIKFNICTDEDCKTKATDAYGKEYGVLTTNNEGKIILENLLYKTYYLQEVETLEHYKLDTTIKDVVINKTSVTMEIGNSPLGNIKVTKIDTQSKKPLAGAVFELYDTANKKITQDAYGNSLGTLTSNANGEVTISNLLYGTYVLREVKNPTNYKNEVIEKTIIINESTLDDNAIYTVTYENVPIGDLRITKKDSQNGSVLSGVVFELLDSEGNPAVNAYGEEIGELTTNSLGEILVEDLVLGDYQLKEIKNPLGYVVISEIITVDLNSPYLAIEVLNVPIEVTIVKKAMDEEFNHLDTILSGATIKIVDIATGETINEFITSEEPTVLRMLPGEYYFYETIAPAGYAKVPVMVKVRVKDDGTIEVVEEEDKVYFEISDKQVTIYNEPSNVLISKFDITNNEELAGAEIVIKDEEGNEVVRFTSTEEEQKFYLKPGIYTLTETVAPEGYDKIVTDLHFELTDDGNVELYEMDENLYYHLESNRIQIYNGPTIEPEVPDTAAFLWIGGIIIGTGLVGAGIYIIRKRYV